MPKMRNVALSQLDPCGLGAWKREFPVVFSSFPLPFDNTLTKMPASEAVGFLDF